MKEHNLASPSQYVARRYHSGRTRSKNTSSQGGTHWFWVLWESPQQSLLFGALPRSHAPPALSWSQRAERQPLPTSQSCKVSSLHYCLQVQDCSKNIWHSIHFLLKSKSFTSPEFPIAPKKRSQQFQPTLPLEWTGAMKCGHLQQRIGTPWIQVFTADQGIDGYFT